MNHILPSQSLGSPIADCSSNRLDSSFFLQSLFQFYHSIDMLRGKYFKLLFDYFDLLLLSFQSILFALT